MKIGELFKIVEGAIVFTRTSGDSPVTYLSETYTPEIIGRTEAEVKNEISRNNLELSFSLNSDIAQRYMGSIIDNIVTLTIYTQQDAGTLVTWKGRMSSVKPQDAIVKIVFENLYTSLRRPGLRRRYQVNCPHVLYGRGCNLDMAGFAVGGTAATVAGATVTSAAAGAYADGYFQGGILKAPDNTLRFITAHVGTTLTLIRPIASLANGNAITIYPGCDRTRQTCLDKFNNINNNGSTPFIPIKNPYSGTSFV